MIELETAAYKGFETKFESRSLLNDRKTKVKEFKKGDFMKLTVLNSMALVLVFPALVLAEGGSDLQQPDLCGGQTQFRCGPAIASYFKKYYKAPTGYKVRSSKDDTNYNETIIGETYNPTTGGTVYIPVKLESGTSLKFTLVSNDGKKVCAGGTASTEMNKAYKACSYDTEQTLESICLSGLSPDDFEVNLPENCGTSL